MSSMLTSNHYIIALALATVFALWWISRDVAGVKTQVADLKSHRVLAEDFDEDDGFDEPPAPPAPKRVHFEDEAPIVAQPAPPPAPPPATDDA